MEQNVAKREENSLQEYQTQLGQISELLIKTMHCATSETEFAYLEDLINEYIIENKKKSKELQLFLYQTSFVLNEKLRQNMTHHPKTEAIPVNPNLSVNFNSAALIVSASEEEARFYNKDILDTKGSTLIEAIKEADLSLASDEIYKNLKLLGQFLTSQKDTYNGKHTNQTKKYTSAIKNALSKIKVGKYNEYSSNTKHTDSSSSGDKKDDGSLELTKSLIHTLKTKSECSIHSHGHNTPQKVTSARFGIK